MNITARILTLAAILLLCVSCTWFTHQRPSLEDAHATYFSTGTGKFEGDLDVRWIKPDRFLYLPDPDHPFRFTTSDHFVITPPKMYTDGGSIPRELWAIKDFSPWAYGPAFVIHDWLFEAHHCHTPGYENLSFERSATILAEGIKTLMETGVAPKDEVALWLIYDGVRTPTAKALWDNPNGCRPPQEAMNLEERSPGELLFTIHSEGNLSQR
jgi:hypothetical protein